MINATLIFPYVDNTSILQAVQFCDECGWIVQSLRLKMAKSFTANQLAVNIGMEVDALDDPEDEYEAREMLEKEMEVNSEASEKVIDILIGNATDFKKGNEA